MKLSLPFTFYKGPWLFMVWMDLTDWGFGFHVHNHRDWKDFRIHLGPFAMSIGWDRDLA